MENSIIIDLKRNGKNKELVNFSTFSDFFQPDYSQLALSEQKFTNTNER
jgi:DNA repair photolyase